jgi:hypothetical protein
MSKSEMQQLGEFVKGRLTTMWSNVAKEHLTPGEKLRFEMNVLKKEIDGSIKDTKDRLQDRQLTDEEMQQVDELQEEADRITEQIEKGDLETAKEAFLAMLGAQPFLSAQDEALKDVFESTLAGEYEPKDKKEIQGLVEGESQFLETLKGKDYTGEGLKEVQEKFTAEVTGKPTKDIEEAEKAFLGNLK